MEFSFSLFFFPHFLKTSFKNVEMDNWFFIGRRGYKLKSNYNNSLTVSEQKKNNGQTAKTKTKNSFNHFFPWKL